MIVAIQFSDLVHVSCHFEHCKTGMDAGTGKKQTLRAVLIDVAKLVYLRLNEFTWIAYLKLYLSSFALEVYDLS